jgi:UDP-2-acetamido-2-deoxy-ribo-hexuluronate aminotransferase
MQPVFASLDLAPDAFPRAVAAGRRVMSLPMHPFLDEATQDKIVAAVKTAVGR